MILATTWWPRWSQALDLFSQPHNGWTRSEKLRIVRDGPSTSVTISLRSWQAFNRILVLDNKYRHGAATLSVPHGSIEAFIDIDAWSSPQMKTSAITAPACVPYPGNNAGELATLHFQIVARTHHYVADRCFCGSPFCQHDR